MFQVDPTSGVITRTLVIPNPSILTSFSSFGQSVAMDGNVMVIGAMNDRSISSLFNTGAAYIYTRASTSATTYTRSITQMLHPAPASSDFCGASVAGTRTQPNCSFLLALMTANLQFPANLSACRVMEMTLP